MVYMSCLLSCRTSYDLKMIGDQKNQENLKTSWNDSLVLSLTPKIKILPILAKIL